MSNKRCIRYQTASAAETFALGQRLGALVEGGVVIALHGDLGAGKTTFTQGLARGMGVNVVVTSPTFTLVNEYTAPTGLTLVHVDSYRLGEAASESMLEAKTFGLEELLDDADTVAVIEWAERVAELLPADHLSVRFQHLSDQPDERQIEWLSSGPIGEKILRAIFGENT